GNPQQALKDKGVIDSGCSRRMTGNISFLSDFKEFNGGYVAFGENPKGDKIIGKGKIKTGKLDFDDVYFVKELKFNLFSVLQMCDKKNNVLFTDTECVVLSSEFKLPDENYVLLKVPRENNMYNVDLKNFVPSGYLTCLFAKATLDESNLWHRSLGHINFKNMNKLVKGNLVRGLPSKFFENNHTCVACKKGKKYRASCKSKPVSSVSHSLQRLHMDLFGPTFVKSLNKKSYCLVVIDDYSSGSDKPEKHDDKVKRDDKGKSPVGFENPDYPDKVYKVVKALYELRQAPRAWYETLANYLLENGFQRGKIDQTLFIKKKKGDILLVQVYVDDIIFRSTNKELCKAFEKLMKDMFQMSSMGELTFFLGLQVKQKDDGIFISQDKYVAEILRKFGFTDVKSASTLIETKKPLLKDLDVKRIFRYLKGKPHLGLWYPEDSPFNLVAYSDSDYARASLDRKSTTGGCQFLGCRLISWQCKKQTVVATSSTEAEYVAAASYCAQVLWIQNQLLDYGKELASPKKTALEEEVEVEVPTAPTPTSLTNAPLPPLQDPTPTPYASPIQEQPTKTSEFSIPLLNTLRMHPNKGKIEAIDADEDITLVDVETQEEEKDDLERAQVLQQQYDDKEENIDWNAVTEQIQEKHLDNIRKYQSLKRKTVSIAQARKNMIIYLKNMDGYKMEHFRGMTYDKVRPIFEREYKNVQTLFKPNKDVEKPTKKRFAEETLLQESFKKLKVFEVSGSESTQETPTTDLKEMSKEDVDNMLEIVPVSEFKIIRVGGITEAYQSFKDMLKGFDREDLVALWKLVKDKFSSAVPNVDKEKALWVELKRLFELDAEDVLWKLQRYMHYPITWKLYSNCGVHQLSLTTRRHDMFMLTEKDYPLSNGIMTLMLSAKLQVEEDSDMARDLVMKIFMEANKPKSRSLDTSSNAPLKHVWRKKLNTHTSILKELVLPRATLELYIINDVYKSKLKLIRRITYNVPIKYNYNKIKSSKAEDVFRVLLVLKLVLQLGSSLSLIVLEPL
nr:putative ribonuclease H-like domain-containing protein [Tanacetum cinerariifolium]